MLAIWSGSIMIQWKCFAELIYAVEQAATTSLYEMCTVYLGYAQCIAFIEIPL